MKKRSNFDLFSEKAKSVLNAKKQRGEDLSESFSDNLRLDGLFGDGDVVYDHDIGRGVLDHIVRGGSHDHPGERVGPRLAHHD